MRRDGQTDRLYTANGRFSHFRNFANAPKMGWGGGRHIGEYEYKKPKF